MPHINPEVLVEQLEKLQKLLSEVWTLSKSYDALAKLQEVQDRLDVLVQTIYTFVEKSEKNSESE
jgi:hypothetical protein